MQDPNTLEPEGQAGGADEPTAAKPITTETVEGPIAEEAQGVAEVVNEEGEVRPAADESVTDAVETEVTEEAPVVASATESQTEVTESQTEMTEPGTEEEAPETAADTPAADTVASEPVGSEVALAEPAATAVPKTPGLWTDEQVEAFRARLREVTAKAVDKAAGAVIVAVNTVAAAIRSRTSSERRGDDSHG